jgi:hypothetical protein
MIDLYLESISVESEAQLVLKLLQSSNLCLFVFFDGAESLQLAF